MPESDHRIALGFEGVGTVVGVQGRAGQDFRAMPVAVLDAAW